MKKYGILDLRLVNLHVCYCATELFLNKNQMFVLFYDMIYFSLGYLLYKLIQNDALFYSILIIFILVLNVFCRKIKLKLKIILNLAVISGLFVSLIFPYIKGEKIHNNINCTYELVNKIKEYRNKNGSLPLSLSEVEVPPCASKLNLKYEILNKGSIFNYELLKEDSFVITLVIPELTLYQLKFAGHRKEFYGED